MGDRRIIPEPPFRRRREGEMLAEAPAALACVLWQYVRHLRDWAEAPPTERGLLFVREPKKWVLAKRREAQLCESELVWALGILDAFVGAPLQAVPSQVASACEKIARWAEALHFVETSIQFAEAAAVIDREDARFANLGGRITRNASDTLRAEVWFERAIGLARARRDWVEYTRAHLGAGILAMGLGREARARRHFNTASTIAMREGHEWLAAEAQHDLFQFVTVRGNYVDAEIHARRALAWYPKHHPRFPFFVADVAFLMVSQCHFTPAVRLLRRFVRTVKPPHNILGYSLLVRGLAEAGQAQEYERTRIRLLKLIAAHKEHEAAARWNLAHAERAAGQWDAAVTDARAAAELARAQRDRETESLAERLLRELETRAPAPAELRRTDEQFRQLVDTLTSRLSEWSPTRRGRLPSLSRADWAA